MHPEDFFLPAKNLYFLYLPSSVKVISPRFVSTSLFSTSPFVLANSFPLFFYDHNHIVRGAIRNISRSLVFKKNRDSRKSGVEATEIVCHCIFAGKVVKDLSLEILIWSRKIWKKKGEELICTSSIYILSARKCIIVRKKEKNTRCNRDLG